MILGITGSSGTGKSTVCKILQEKYQANIIDADCIAKKLSKKGTPYYTKVVESFGTEILLENEELNRSKLAKIIYQNSQKRELLNQCTFGFIQQEMKRQIQTLNSKIIAIDAPLLFEAELEKLCDYTIAVVTSKKEMQLQRVMQRDHIDEKQALARIQAQHENNYYQEKCNFCITNDSDTKQIEQQIKEILENTLHFC